jgi:tellurite resistance protein TehA-like permease
MTGLRELNPGYFALVMATGIVSRAMRLNGATGLSAVLLGAGIVAFVLLTVAYAGRFARYRGEFLADARDPRRAFGYFTFVAASDVLAVALVADGRPTAATAAAAFLLAIGSAGWLLLTYSLPLLLAGGSVLRPALSGANGTWFMWVVGTQLIAVAATAFPPPVPAGLAALAIVCWAVGVVLYLVITVMVTIARLQYPVRPGELGPAYWVFMGATAISTLAGAKLLTLPPSPLAAAVREIVAGLSVILWAFGTWLVPLLLILGVWRHVVHRVPLTYEPGLWSIVFPIGMYGVAGHQLGAALGASWLMGLGRYAAWLAFAGWAAVALGMAWAPVKRTARAVRAAAHVRRPRPGGAARPGAASRKSTYLF